MITDTNTSVDGEGGDGDGSLWGMENGEIGVESFLECSRRRRRDRR
jgi:hypothetical protein